MGSYKHVCIFCVYKENLSHNENPGLKSDDEILDMDDSRDRTTLLWYVQYFFAHDNNSENIAQHGNIF